MRAIPARLAKMTRQGILKIENGGNVTLGTIALLWAVWVVTLSATALEDPRPLPLVTLPILAVAALIGWFLFAMFKAGKRVDSN
jgi:hypothetical protein